MAFVADGCFYSIRSRSEALAISGYVPIGRRQRAHTYGHQPPSQARIAKSANLVLNDTIVRHVYLKFRKEKLLSPPGSEAVRTYETHMPRRRS